MTKKKRKEVIQIHHISYNPEVTVKMYRKEHFLITKLDRYKYISMGFIRALEWFILRNKDKANDLEGVEQ